MIKILKREISLFSDADKFVKNNDSTIITYHLLQDSIVHGSACVIDERDCRFGSFAGARMNLASGCHSMIPRVHPAALNCFAGRSRAFFLGRVCCRRRLEILRSVSPLFRPRPPLFHLSLFSLIVREPPLLFYSTRSSAGHRAGSCLQRPVTRLRSKSRSAYVRAREPKSKTEDTKYDVIASNRVHIR